MAFRIIPKLLLRDGFLVDSLNFNRYRKLGDLRQALSVYTIRDVDEIILNISRSTTVAPDIETLLSTVLNGIRVPLTFGGGIAVLSDAIMRIRGGADRVAIGTGLFLNRALAGDVLGALGAQALVVCLDVRRSASGWSCYTHSGMTDTKMDVFSAIEILQNQLPGEFLITSIDNTGSRRGFDLDLYEAISKRFDISVIASGGAGTLAHFLDLSEIKGLRGAAAASIFHFTQIRPKDIKDYLRSNGVDVRRS